MIFAKPTDRCTSVVSAVLLLTGIEKKTWSITRLHNRGDDGPPWLLLFIVLRPLEGFCTNALVLDTKLVVIHTGL